MDTEWPPVWKALANRLKWPDNMGLTFYRLELESTPPAAVLLVWFDGLTPEEKLRSAVLGPLVAYRGSGSLTGIRRAVLGCSQQQTSDVERVAEAVAQGAVAVLMEEAGEALLVDLMEVGEAAPPQPKVAHVTVELRRNLALVRERIRNPELLALPVRTKGDPPVTCALLYIASKAQPDLVRKVRRWASQHVAPEMVRMGRLIGFGASLGLIPRFDTLDLADVAAALVNQGYVLLLVDGVPHLFAAPVTLAAWVTGPRDAWFAYPLKQLMVIERLLAAWVMLLLPGAIVALLNYHINMVPAGFLAAFATTREHAPLSLVLEILFLELLVDTLREITFYLPVGMTPGTGLAVLALVLLIAVQSGFVGPLSALVALTGALSSLSLPAYGGLYLVRVWRYALLGAGGVLGFYGMALATVVFLDYLCRARTWSIPFLGPSGNWFTAGEGDAAAQPAPQGRSWTSPNLR